jgi:quercetin dioxygenase-like cupin family protein
VEIRRFGPGHRRSERAAGSIGTTASLLHAGPGARITELALDERALFGPLRSPLRGLLIMIEGGGWLALGDERQRVAAGEAIVLPADAERLLASDGAPLRAILVEFDDAPSLNEGHDDKGGNGDGA